MVKIPRQPKISESAPGHIEVDVAQFNREMEKFKKLFDEAVSDCNPNDPDAIIAAVFNKLLDKDNQ